MDEVNDIVDCRFAIADRRWSIRDGRVLSQGLAGRMASSNRHSEIGNRQLTTLSYNPPAEGD